MESQLLELIKRHCTRKKVVHWLAVPFMWIVKLFGCECQLFPTICIIVSSMSAVSKEWLNAWATPKKWTEQERCIENIMQEKRRGKSDNSEVHGAMYDIERSIELSKSFKPCFEMF